jgi:hypothetical protein
MKDTKQTSSKLARQQRLRAVARKKVIIAGCLLLVMGGLWIRVFAKKGGKNIPAKANAVTVEKNTTDTAVKSASRGAALRYINIEVVKGRNDALVRDVFSQKPWIGKDYKHITTSTDSWANDQKILKEDIRSAAKKLKLEAIIMGQERKLSEIFINNKLVPEGSDFPIRHDGRIFRFTVTEVGPEKVVLKCLDVEVTLKMSQKG